MKLFNVSRSKYRLEEIKNKNKYAIEREKGNTIPFRKCKVGFSL